MLKFSPPPFSSSFNIHSCPTLHNSQSITRNPLQVGDSLDDMAAGYRASAATVLLSPPPAIPTATTTATATAISSSNTTTTTTTTTTSTPTSTSTQQQQQQQPSSSSTETKETLRTHEFTGLWIESLDELIGVLEGGFEERERRGEESKGG